jgi:hypothetical protein
MESEMKATVTIKKPRTMVEGWTGFVTDPRSGAKVDLKAYCGGGLVAFSTKEALLKEAKRVVRGFS